MATCSQDGSCVAGERRGLRTRIRSYGVACARSEAWG